MRLKQHLNELSMKSAKIEDIKITATSFRATIIAGNDAFYFNAFAHDIKYSQFFWDFLRKLDYSGEEIGKIIDATYEKIWEIDFEDAEGKQTIAPKEKGVSLQLFAGLEETIKLFEKKFNPKIFYFSSFNNETSRLKLYRLIANRIKKAGYKTFDFMKGTLLYFVFWSKDFKI